MGVGMYERGVAERGCRGDYVSRYGPNPRISASHRLHICIRIYVDTSTYM
jgi:hypothetical protein